MDVERGGIYLYDPPKNANAEHEQGALVATSGSEQSGLRPWIVMSSQRVNANRPTAVGVPLTTKTDKANAFRIPIPVAELIREPGCQYQFRSSVALCDHVQVLDKKLILRKVGTLSTNAVFAVQLGLEYVFDIR